MEKGHHEYWLARLDELKSRLGIATYAGLARHLGMSKQGLAHVRAGRQDLSVETKLAVLSQLGGEVSDEAFEGLFPHKTRREVGGKVTGIFDPEDGEQYDDGFWVARIEQIKEKMDVNSDYELARALSISPTMLSNQRAGKDGLSSVAKIKILDKLGYAVARDALVSLLPPRIRKKFVDFDNLRFVGSGNKSEKSSTANRK